MTLRNAARFMGISSKTLQKVVHDLKLIRYVEKYNNQNQRTFDLEDSDVKKLLDMKKKSGARDWRVFLTIFTDRPQIKTYSTRFVQEVDPRLLKKIVR
ncbi:DNA-binding protein [Leptospira stimsonii]|uniref:DNA-binding protein n=1 Tax=Leptospira stimsonii TaxID=2202203 RepID=A0ABY2N9E1_9LEPT|nr:DNA-binding protein [Leptospira stimsonii]TGM18777.1 DNA-binding protein [Leptospira stimsonii]